MQQGRGKKKSNGDQSQKKNPKVHYKPHLKRGDLSSGLKQGRFYIGKLRINSKNSRDAYVTCDNLPHDVYLEGRTSRNRAFDGDEVVVKLADGSFAGVKESRDKQLPSSSSTALRDSSSNTTGVENPLSIDELLADLNIDENHGSTVVTAPPVYHREDDGVLEDSKVSQSSKEARKGEVVGIWKSDHGDEWPGLSVAVADIHSIFIVLVFSSHICSVAHNPT